MSLSRLGVSGAKIGDSAATSPTTFAQPGLSSGPSVATGAAAAGAGAIATSLGWLTSATLSYFIEPNPARRGWQYRHRYASHGLRFDVKTATESLGQFRQRINRAARAEEEGATSMSDAKEWALGPDLRGLGSLHSDRWTGPARDLADRGFLGVYPVIGWWRERPALGRVHDRARYSLIVSIRSPSVDVDLYTPVSVQVATPVTVPT